MYDGYAKGMYARETTTAERMGAMAASAVMIGKWGGDRTKVAEEVVTEHDRITAKFDAAETVQL